MGANRERLNALRVAVTHGPRHAMVLAGKLTSGNVAMRDWASCVQASGRQPLFIVMIERLGDVIACTPIASHLRMLYPDSSIAWVCSQKYSDVLEGNPNIDVIFHEESLAGWLLTKRHLPKPIQCYELFLDSQRCCWTGMRLPGRNSGINHQNYLAEGRNLLTAYASAAGITGIVEARPEMFLTGKAPRLPARLVELPLMVVHFDSEDPDRRLSFEALSTFVATALQKGWAIVEVGLNPHASKVDSRVHFLSAAHPLTDHVLLLKTAKHFAGVDSAFLHCANAYQIPSTLYLGKFRHFKSFRTFSGGFLLSDQCTLIRGNAPTTEIAPDIVFRAVPDSPFIPEVKVGNA